MPVEVNDVLIVLALSVSKFTVGFITSMVIPIFPSLVSFHLNKPPGFLSSNLSSMVNGTDLSMESLGNITSLFSSQQNSTDYNHLRLSLLFATKNFCQIVCSPVVGCLIDACGALVFLLSGAIFQIFTVLVYGLAEVYYLLILGRILEAISASSINCACAAFVAYRFKDPRQRGFMYGINGLSLCIGSALGPAYGGVIYQYFGKKTAFLSVISFSFVEIIFAVLVIFRERKGREKSAMETEPKKDFISSIESVIPIPLTELLPASTVVDANEDVVLKNGSNNDATFRNSLIPEEPETKEITKVDSTHNVLVFIKDPYFLISIGTFPVLFISIFMLFSTLPLYMEVTYSATKSEQGLIWILSLLGYALGFISGNIINTRFAKRRHIILVVYTWIHACGMACIESMTVWWAISLPLCTIVHVHLVAEIVVAPILATIVEKRHHSKFGVMSGIVMMTIAATGSTGSFLGPNLMRIIGFRYMNIGVCVINVIYSPLYLFLRRFC